MGTHTDNQVLVFYLAVLYLGFALLINTSFIITGYFTDRIFTSGTRSVRILVDVRGGRGKCYERES